MVVWYCTVCLLNPFPFIYPPWKYFVQSQSFFLQQNMLPSTRPTFSQPISIWWVNYPTAAQLCLLETFLTCKVFIITTVDNKKLDSKPKTIICILIHSIKFQLGRGKNAYQKGNVNSVLLVHLSVRPSVRPSVRLSVYNTSQK